MHLPFQVQEQFLSQALSTALMAETRHPHSPSLQSLVSSKKKEERKEAEECRKEGEEEEKSPVNYELEGAQ